MKTIRTLCAFALVAGVLMIPALAKADTVTVAPGCEVHYDSGHASVDPRTGAVDFESPSASASTGGCFTTHITIEDLLPSICCIIRDPLPPPCCIDDWLGISW
ncbi:MAG TPA: hypothetical protein VEV43_10095 [Actinomycetota bacterium]|nr:hypothetical protein [Actinomycetota bacterium]